MKSRNSILTRHITNMATADNQLTKQTIFKTILEKNVCFEIFFKQNSQVIFNTYKMAKSNEKKNKSPEKKPAEQLKADVTMFIGDSNLRNTYMAYKKIIDDKFGENIFEQATTNETIKIMLSGCNIDEINKVYVGSILNEVGRKCRPLEPADRDEMQLKIVREQVDLINEFSKANPSLKFIILCPLTRGDPDWIEEKFRRLCNN